MSVQSTPGPRPTRRRRPLWPWFAAGVAAGVVVVCGVLAIIGVIVGDQDDQQATAADPPPATAPAPDPDPQPEDPAGLTDAEQAYVDAVIQAGRDAGRGVHALGDQALLDIGRAVCDDIAAGQAPGDVAQDLTRVDGPVGDPAVATAIVGNAEIYLCG